MGVDLFQPWNNYIYRVLCHFIVPTEIFVYLLLIYKLFIHYLSFIINIAKCDQVGYKEIQMNMFKD